LDALCARFSIDTSARTLHGALLDARLLGEVYLELIGGRQATIELVTDAVVPVPQPIADRPVRAPRPHAPSAAELAAHAAMLQQIKTPIWLDARREVRHRRPVRPVPPPQPPAGEGR